MILADSSLEPHEKEEQEVHGLIHKRPPHSRKYTERRGPKHDNREDKIKTDDSDMGGCTVEQDRDMSLNYKNIGGSNKFAISPAPLPGMAVKDEENKTKEDDKESDPEPKANEKSYNAKYESLKEKLNKISPSLVSDLDKATKFDAFSNATWSQKINSIQKANDNLEALTKQHYGQLKESDDPVEYVQKNWESKPGKWVTRAALIRAVKSIRDSFPLKGSIKAALSRDDLSTAIEDKELIKQIIEGGGEKGKGKDKDKGRDDEETVSKFAQWAALYNSIKQNKDDIKGVKDDANKVSEEISNQFQRLSDLNNIMDAWRSTVQGLKSSDIQKDDLKHGVDLKKAIHSLKSFFGIGGERRMKIVHPTIFMDGLIEDFKKKHGEVPAELKALSSEVAKESTKSKEASNEISRFRNMATRLATYHGIKDVKGNPTDPPNTPYKSYDKRYFDEDHWKSIIKYANELLKDDWFKFGWSGTPKDSQLRAALDVSIHLADSNLYQSKIDADTYNMLLNRLGEWGYDPFSETILPFKKGKQASNLEKVAADRQQEGPKMSSNVQSLRSLVSTEAPLDSPVKEQAAATPPKEGGESEEAKKLTDEIHGLLKQHQMDKDIEAFIEGGKKGGFKDLHSLLDKYRKASSRFASIRIAAEAIDELLESLGGELSNLEDMSSDEIQKALETDQANEIIKDFDQAARLEGPEALEKMLKSLKMLSQISRQASSGYVPVRLSTLIAAAYGNPAVRPILLPIIITAAKKKMKKGPKKGKKDDKKGPPKKDKKDDKKGPPKDKKSPSKGKKSPPKTVKVETPWMKEPPVKQASKSPTIGSDDLDW